MTDIYVLPPGCGFFPHPATAHTHGLLCIGADLSPEQLILAYRYGIYPWYCEGDPIIWWSPDPRLVLYPDELKIAKSMRSYLSQEKFQISFDKEFETVIDRCQKSPRKRQGGTWITREMMGAYTKLHKLGYAHSLEVWSGEELAGGLYGVAIGNIFFGESMFHNISNASKFGFIKLVEFLKNRNFQLIDCQQETRHLRSLGARAISRNRFLEHLRDNLFARTEKGPWTDLT